MNKHSNSLSASNMKVLEYTITFRINYQCKFGESIGLIGNVASLGEWDTERVTLMTWKPVHPFDYEILTDVLCRMTIG
jgi:hypothetical protein